MKCSMCTTKSRSSSTIMEATVVVNLAVDMAAALTAGLQVRYPALQTAEDLLFVLMDHPSSSLQDQIANASREVREKFEKNGTYAFVPGMLLNDFATVWWTLASFSSTVAAQEDKKDLYWNLIAIPDEDYEDRYGEERTPQLLLPDSDNMVLFLLQQLPMLYNAICGKKEKKKMKVFQTGYVRQKLVHSFKALFVEYFQTRKVTVPLVFFCICWIKSVAALQGDAGLSRNISLTIQHSTMMKKMEASLEKGDTHLHTHIVDCATEIRTSTQAHALSRMNPLLAGYMMITHHLKYLLLASGILLPTSMLRAFGHLYLALTEQGFLERIPFLDELLEIYEDKIFTPSRAAAVHGSYNRAYLLSNHHTTAAVNAIYRGELLPDSKCFTKDRSKFPEDLSDTFHLIIDKDMSYLGSTSPRLMLRKAADICSRELFDTRILSRDLLALNGDLEEVFSEMCDALERRQFHTEFTADKEREGSCGSTVHTPVTAVMFPLLSLLDCLQRDGSMNWRTLPVGLFTHRECAVDGEQVRTMCKKVSAVIKAKFATPALVCQSRYFLFPSKPNFVDQEYGTVSFKHKTSVESRAGVFSELMNLLKSSGGPLSKTDLDHLKTEVKKDPELLGMMLHVNTYHANTPENDLCTLLHQAAAGPAHDINLVEWMIQMGAFTNQPLHCRGQSKQCLAETSCESLPNTMAIHSAVIAGHEVIVRMMLDTDNLVDLNTPTFHEKDTLAHLAVKHGHRDLLFLLRSFGADVFIRNQCGEHVGDLVAALDWTDENAEISASMSILPEGYDKIKSQETFRHQVSVRAERFRELIFAHRDDDRQRAPRKNSIAAKQAKRKKRMRNRQGGNTVGTSIPEARSFIIDQRVSTDGSSLEMILTKMSSLFARLRDPSIAGVDKASDAERACIAIKKLMGLTELLTRPEALEFSELQLRLTVSFEAYRVIHMAQKFYRVDHVAVKGPVLAPLRKLCATTREFTKFVLSTAQLCVSISRKSQARELLDLLEKRFLKTPFAMREVPVFRDMVQKYSTVRKTLDFGRTSHIDAFSSLEWYLSNWMSNDALVVKLDRICGCLFYFLLQADTSSQGFEAFEAALNGMDKLEGVVCLHQNGTYVVYGSNFQEDVIRTRKLVLDISRDFGIYFSNLSSQPWTSAISIGTFQFSSAGVFRNAPAA